MVDASFDVPTTWVAAVNRDSLVIRSGLLGTRSGRTRGTIRFVVRENAQLGALSPGGCNSAGPMAAGAVAVRVISS